MVLIEDLRKDRVSLPQRCTALYSLVKPREVEHNRRANIRRKGSASRVVSSSCAVLIPNQSFGENVSIRVYVVNRCPAAHIDCASQKWTVTDQALLSTLARQYSMDASIEFRLLIHYQTCICFNVNLLVSDSSVNRTLYRSTDKTPSSALV
jgi:hypothetical protein